MENENILTENQPIKVKSKYRIPLIIIGILLIILIGLGIYLFVRTENPRNVYLGLIDDTVEVINNAFDEVSYLNNTAFKNSEEISFELNYGDAEMKPYVDIINRLKIKVDSEFDVKSEKANVAVDILYSNQDMIDAELIVKDNAMYARLGDLYNKDIKLPIEDLDTIWNVYDFETYKTITTEFATILKNNLTENYFSKESVRININNKSVATIKYVLDLDSDEINTISNNVLEDMKSNDKIINSFVDLLGVSKEEIIDTFDYSKDTTEEDAKLLLEIYVNKFNKNVERIGVNTIIFDRVSNEEYSIIDNNTNDVLGSLKFADETLKLIMEDEEAKINLEIKERKIGIAFESFGDIIDLNYTFNETDANGFIRIASAEEAMDLKINLTTSIKEIDSVSDKIVSNYIELEQMNEEDYNVIMQNLYQNSTLMTLFQDIMSLDSGSVLENPTTF